MRKTAFLHLAVSGLSIGMIISFSSCSPDNGNLPLSSAINTTSGASEANAMLTQAKAYESAGKTSKAVSAYRDITKKYPQENTAAEARFAEARILDQQGDLLKAFEAYQDLIVSYPSSPHYAKAIQRQESVAHAAANGIIKNNFLGMKTKISPEKTTKMLADVRDNAPKAVSAPKAQYVIGRVWQKAGNAEKSTAAYQRILTDYPNSGPAPEALYQTGEILIIKAERGNQNKANLNQAKDIYQDLLLQYPNHSRAADARKRIAMLKGQDVQRSYDTAEFYRKKSNTKAAIFYYREVVRKTKSGSLHDMATARISELGG